MRERAPVLITIVVGIFMVLKFFLTVPWIRAVADELEQWCLIVVAASVVLGVANILRINLKIIRRKGPDWGHKLVLVASMVLMMGAGVFDLATRGDVAAGGTFQYLFEYAFTPLAATMFALLAFFIASAAFRAFRAHNFRAGLLLVSGVFVMIGRVPLGAAISSYFPKIADWLMAYPNAAGQRGMILGAALGVLATGLRIIFGVERPYLRGD